MPCQLCQGTLALRWPEVAVLAKEARCSLGLAKEARCSLGVDPKMNSHLLSLQVLQEAPGRLPPPWS